MLAVSLSFPRPLSFKVCSSGMSPSCASCAPETACWAIQLGLHVICRLPGCISLPHEILHCLICALFHLLHLNPRLLSFLDMMVKRRVLAFPRPLGYLSTF
ncbi:hypothetical protein KC330_g46 [Hortaea werneckii]|nr:hypothetical protein KC330_g46 [Hortaea werneckii]